MAKFIVEAKSAKDLHRGNFEVIEPYNDTGFEDAIRDQEALEMQEVCQNKIQQLEKKLAILANTIEENELMDYHLSKACLEDEKKLKRKISDLKKERSELRQKNASQAARKHDLHCEIDALERNKILLDAENQQLRKIVAQDRKIGEDFVIKDSKDIDWSNMTFDYSDNSGWTCEPTKLEYIETVNLISLEVGDSVICLKDYFADIDVNDEVTLKSILGSNYLFELKNGKRTWVRKDSVTNDSFQYVTKDKGTLGWYVSKGYVVGFYSESKLIELLSKGETIYGNKKDADCQVAESVMSK